MSRRQLVTLNKLVVLFPTAQPTGDPDRVVITGTGIVTALGLDWASNAEGFRVGRVAFRPVTLFDVSRQRVKTAAEVTLPDELPSTHLAKRHIDRLDRAAKLLLVAAAQAWRQSGWAPSSNLPVILGTTSGSMSLGEAYYRQALGQRARLRFFERESDDGFWWFSYWRWWGA